MLLNNGTWFGKLKPMGGMMVIPSALLFNSQRVKLWENAQRFGETKSVPQGYQSALSAIIPSLARSSDMSWLVRGSGDFTSAANGIGELVATLTGEGTLTPEGQMGGEIYATLTGEGTVTVQLRGIGSLTVTLDAGARPSAFDIAQEVLQALNATTIPVNVEKINDIDVNGVGTSGDPWGP
jgi:hypothetical protein